MKVKVWRAKMERISKIKNLAKRMRLREAGYEEVFRYLRRQRKKKKQLNLSTPMLHAHYPLSNKPFNILSTDPGKYLGAQENCPYCLQAKALRRAARKEKKRKKKKRG